VIVTLNPVSPIRAANVLERFEYSHPVFDQAAIDAQERLPALQGIRNTWFCGAWTGYGFHEDGLRSGLNVANLISEQQAGRRQRSNTNMTSASVNA
jgi:predicted NAD/FAD-binding protein